jgi:hypothetical protein
MQQVVHPCGELRQRRTAIGRDNAQRRLDDRHDQGRCDSLAGDVRKRDSDALVTKVEKVVVIAPDGSCRHAERRERGRPPLRWGIGQQPSLDLCRQREIAAQLLLLDDARGQAGVLEHQRELLAAPAKSVTLGVAVILAAGRSAK